MLIDFIFWCFAKAVRSNTTVSRLGAIAWSGTCRISRHCLPHRWLVTHACLSHIRARIVGRVDTNWTTISFSVGGVPVWIKLCSAEVRIISILVADTLNRGMKKQHEFRLEWIENKVAQRCRGSDSLATSKNCWSHRIPNS